ncbi:hypothetical protein [Tenacibaculum ovolyticum]|uniref:hypothetical protein n=1 Tax=Tenacibaculum ovolyticum TaxID=104270 RepID=UPI0004106F19|nr:hypothetical protein [Tenacibaculum ovolyticum]
MKKKHLFILILGFIFGSLSAQNEIFNFKNSLKENSTDIKNVIPIVNKENGNLAYFIADAKNVYAYKFNENFVLQDKLSSEEKRRKFKTLIGYSISKNGSYSAFLTNKNKKKFLMVNFSFLKKKTTSKEFKLESNGEKFIQTASVKNNFYLISTKTGIDGLFIYEFNEKGTIKRNKIDLSHLKFTSRLGRKTKIVNLLSYSKKDINKIDENSPNPIEIVADKEKMYVRKNKIIFTFDSNKSFSQVLIIDLNTFKATSKIFNKPLPEIKSIKKKTNSFILHNNIFVLASTKNELILDIIDYDSGKSKKKLTIFKEEPILFKNTPIIQEGGYYANYRELNKTKKFLRKINAGKIGISARKYNEKFQLTIGGHTIQHNSGMMIGSMIGGISTGIAIASLGNTTVFFNPTQFTFNATLNSKSTRIECLFDQNFNHINGEIDKNVFDKMQKDNENFTNDMTVIKYKNYFIKGSYNKKMKMYTLKKYTD